MRSVGGVRPLMRALCAAVCLVMFASMSASARPDSLVSYPVTFPGHDITTGPDGAMWFTSDTDGQIGRLATDGAFTSYPTGHAFVRGITASPDGALWFTAGDCAPSCTTTIGRMSIAGIVTSTYALPRASVIGREIVTGPDGALWFTAVSACCAPIARDVIGRITTAGRLRVFPLPSGQGLANSGAITSGPHRLWFIEPDAIGRIGARGRFSSPFAAPGADGDITVGPDGALWYSAGDGAIGRITRRGHITVYPIPACGTPSALTSGPDGNLWFAGGAIGRVTTSGVATEWAIPRDAEQIPDITSGPDGHLWAPVVSNTARRPDSIARIPAAGPAQHGGPHAGECRTLHGV